MLQFSTLKEKNIFKILFISVLASTCLITGCKKQHKSTESKSAMVTSSITIEEPKKDQIKRPDLRSKYEKAAKVNSDAVGWLYIPNTNIDYATMQDLQHKGKKLNDYYYRRNEKGEYSFKGCIISDDENITTPFNKLSPNLVFYGHNVDTTDKANGVHFSQLGKFKDLEFSKKTPYVFLTTKDKDLVYEVYASFYTEEKFQYTYPNRDKKYMSSIIKEAKDRSNFIYDVNVKDTDKIITLSTCTYKFGKYQTRAYYRTKYVVQARLVPEGTKLHSTAKVKVNPNPRKVNWNY